MIEFIQTLSISRCYNTRTRLSILWNRTIYSDTVYSYCVNTVDISIQVGILVMSLISYSYDIDRTFSVSSLLMQTDEWNVGAMNTSGHKNIIYIFERAVRCVIMSPASDTLQFLRIKISFFNRHDVMKTVTGAKIPRSAKLHVEF